MRNPIHGYSPICRLDDDAVAGVKMQVSGAPDIDVRTTGGIDRRVPMLVAGTRTDESNDNDAFIVSETSMVENPSKTLLEVERARAERRMVAVDDVGRRMASFGLLPIIEPDIIVLAPELSVTALDPATARAAHVLAAQTERTGAVIIASGIDTEAHRSRALELGATFGIGELYPAMESPAALSDTRAVLTSHTWSTPSTDATSPFAIAATERKTTRSRKNLLVEMSTHIEWQATTAGPEAMVLGTFQHAQHFSGRTRRRWRTMAANSVYTGVYGVGMDVRSDSSIHHAPLDPTDELAKEWNVVVLGPHFCCVLSARDLLDSGPERELEYVISHDRGTVVRCAKAILHRFGG